jgi:hypothetical protein
VRRIFANAAVGKFLAEKIVAWARIQKCEAPENLWGRYSFGVISYLVTASFLAATSTRTATNSWSTLMNSKEAKALQLHEIVVWNPDGMKGEVIAKDGFGVKICWEDGQLGYYQFTDLLSQIERITLGFDGAVPF